MPILKRFTETTRHYLPSTENLPEEERAWVDMRERVVAEDIARGNMGGANQLTIGLTSFIAAWNFTTEDEVTPVPINTDTVGLMDPRDFNFLIGKMNEAITRVQGGLDKEEKKDLPSTTTPSSTVVRETPKV